MSTVIQTQTPNEIPVTSLDLSVEVKDVDHMAVLTLLWDQLGFTEVLNRCILGDEQLAITPGVAIKALVLNIVGGRDPLYRVAEAYRHVPIAAVLGAGVTLENLNDASLARHLDRLFEAGGHDVFNALSLRVIEREDLKLDRLHADTTSRLVYGEYVNEDQDAISITHGYSKDHRPDLKQVMAGLSVTPDGIPVSAQMLSGNTSDKKWHGGMLETVRTSLRIPEDRPLHHIGDSALITTDNLAIASKHRIVVTGRLPRTVNACDEAVRQALESKEQWEDIGKFGAERDAASYFGCLIRREVLGQTVWLGVYRTSGIDQRVHRSVTRRLEKQSAGLTRQCARLAKRDFACAPDAAAELKRFQSEHEDGLVLVTGEVEAVDVVLPRPNGRPKRGVPAPTQRVYRLKLGVVPDQDRIKQALLEESCFVVLSTRESASSSRELLADYKGQIVVETRFPFLKNPAWADVFFVKKPHRLEALGYVMLMALLLWCVWERRVRANHKTSGEKPIIDVTGDAKASPTAMVCRHILRGIKLCRVVFADGATPWRLAAPLTAEQERVFRFSGAPATHFLENAQRKPPVLLQGG